MHIIRFIDESGAIHYGAPVEEGRAQVLNGGIAEGFVTTDEVKVVMQQLAPVEPVNIFCIGLNYRAHAKETGLPIPETPVVFMKPTTALNHPDSPVVIPAACDQGPEVDYEAELAVVIGRTAKDVAENEALDYVFGYTCANDISARRWQKHGGGGQWIRSKSFDSFCPLGPELVTSDEIANPQNISVRTYLNGKKMQDGHTSDMIFPVASLLAHLSRDLTLLPGTVILTGTPPGVGFARKPPVFLAPGDKMAVELSGIGRLENLVVGS